MNRRNLFRSLLTIPFVNPDLVKPPETKPPKEVVMKLDQRTYTTAYSCCYEDPNSKFYIVDFNLRKT